MFVGNYLFKFVSLALIASTSFYAHPLYSVKGQENPQGENLYQKDDIPRSMTASAFLKFGLQRPKSAPSTPKTRASTSERPSSAGKIPGRKPKSAPARLSMHQLALQNLKGELTGEREAQRASITTRNFTTQKARHNAAHEKKDLSEQHRGILKDLSYEQKLYGIPKNFNLDTLYRMNPQLWNSYTRVLPENLVEELDPRIIRTSFSHFIQEVLISTTFETEPNQPISWVYGADNFNWQAVLNNPRYETTMSKKLSENKGWNRVDLVTWIQECYFACLSEGTDLPWASEISDYKLLLTSGTQNRSKYSYEPLLSETQVGALNPYNKRQYNILKGEYEAIQDGIDLGKLEEEHKELHAAYTRQQETETGDYAHRTRIQEQVSDLENRRNELRKKQSSQLTELAILREAKKDLRHAKASLEGMSREKEKRLLSLTSKRTQIIEELHTQGLPPKLIQAVDNLPYFSNDFEFTENVINRLSVINKHINELISGGTNVSQKEINGFIAKLITIASSQSNSTLQDKHNDRLTFLQKSLNEALLIRIPEKQRTFIDSLESQENEHLSGLKREKASIDLFLKRKEDTLLEAKPLLRELLITQEEIEINNRDIYFLNKIFENKRKADEFLDLFISDKARRVNEFGADLGKISASLSEMEDSKGHSAALSEAKQVFEDSKEKMKKAIMLMMRNQQIIHLEERIANSIQRYMRDSLTHDEAHFRASEVMGMVGVATQLRRNNLEAATNITSEGLSGLKEAQTRLHNLKLDIVSKRADEPKGFKNPDTVAKLASIAFGDHGPFTELLGVIGRLISENEKVVARIREGAKNLLPSETAPAFALFDSLSSLITQQEDGSEDEGDESDWD